MKRKRFFRYVTLLLSVIMLATTLCGCFDVDSVIVDLGLYKKNRDINEKMNVILRESEGYICKDETNLQTVWKGDSVSFHVDIKPGYVYIGNSVNAEYDPIKGVIEIDRIEAPTTIDVYVANKYDLYCVDVFLPDEKVKVEFVKGAEWTETPGEVTIKIIIPKEYEFIEWEILFDSAELEYNASELGFDAFTFKTVEKGIVKIKAICELAEAPQQ